MDCEIEQLKLEVGLAFNEGASKGFDDWNNSRAKQIMNRPRGNFEFAKTESFFCDWQKRHEAYLKTHQSLVGDQ